MLRNLLATTALVAALALGSTPSGAVTVGSFGKHGRAP